MYSGAFKRLNQSIRKEKMVTITNIAVLTIAFFVFGMFISVFFFSRTVLKTLEEQAQVTAFFKDDFVEENILKLKGELELDERILAITYISKEDAFRIFTEVNKDEPILLESVSANILPASLEIKAKDLRDLDSLAEMLNRIDGVEEVKFFKDVIQRFRIWTNIIYIVGLSLVTLFMLIAYAVVIITIRLTIKSKGPELEIQKLVGASDAYVKNPLTHQALSYGVASSLLSSLLLLGGLTGFHYAWPDFKVFVLLDFKINIFAFWGILAVFVFASGIALSYLGSITAIKRYLRY